MGKLRPLPETTCTEQSLSAPSGGLLDIGVSAVQIAIFS